MILTILAIDQLLIFNFITTGVNIMFSIIVREFLIVPFKFIIGVIKNSITTRKGRLYYILILFLIQMFLFLYISYKNYLEVPDKY